MASLTLSQIYQYALQAGFTGQDAIIATAIAKTENPSLDPTVRSGVNTNGTYDLGIMQINSSHWNAYGGQAALTDPLTNMQAAYDLYKNAGNTFTPWSTFNQIAKDAYGVWHIIAWGGGQYLANMPAAQAATSGVDINQVPTVITPTFGDGNGGGSGSGGGGGGFGNGSSSGAGACPGITIINAFQLGPTQVGPLQIPDFACMARNRDGTWGNSFIWDSIFVLVGIMLAFIGLSNMAATKQTVSTIVNAAKVAAVSE